MPSEPPPGPSFGPDQTPAAPGGGPPRKPWWRSMSPLSLTLLAAVAVLVVVVAVVLPGRGGNKSGEVLLEPAASTGPDPFTPNTASSAPATAAASPSFPTPASAGTAPALRSESGAAPGLYGGTGSNTACDANQMAGYLTQNPQKAAAWTEALNSDSTLQWSGGSSLTTNQIPQYLSELTPVLLRADTRVTNNRYIDGHPAPRQSVLEAGSAVMVDKYGVPRVRCSCGNPLLAPRAVPETPVYTGSAWSGFSPNTTVVVNATTVVNTFVLVNVNNGTA